MGHFGPENGTSSQLWIDSKNFFKILQNQRVNENFISCFSREKIICGNSKFLGHFLLLDWAWSELSQGTVTIGSLNSQDMIRFLKQSRHDLSGKHLFGGYCMDIK